MQPLRTRLNGEKEAVLAYTTTYGRLLAMQKFQVKDYISFVTWLKEVTGDEKFGLNPTVNPNGNQDLGDQLVAAFLRKLERLQAENVSLREQLQAATRQPSTQKDKDAQLALLGLQACQD